MDPATLTLVLVVVTALAFDFTNGFHDTGNAMATSIVTKALKPKSAVLLSAVLNLVGAFLSVEVALTVTNSVIRIQDKTGAPDPSLTAGGGMGMLLIILAGLVGAILWNLFTWMLGLPSSSSHALFGGLVGATIAGLGGSYVKWVGDSHHLDGVLGKVMLPSLVAPLIAATVAVTGTRLVLWTTRRVATSYRAKGFRWGQIGAASLVSLAHGTNDAQKTMGVITLALLAAGAHSDTQSVPFWVKVACALAIALGTYLGGWRIIRTMGKGLTELTPPQGFAADASIASTILASSHMGFALSTTHVATGSILGSGLGVRGNQVRWAVAGRMVLAWLTTLPMAGLAGAVMWWVGNGVGGWAGSLVIIAVLVAASALMWWRAKHEPVSAQNVNDEWEPTPVVSLVPERVPA